MRMGLGQKIVLGFKHAFTNVGECKELNPKHFQMRSTLGLVVLQKFQTFGTKLQIINVVQIRPQ